VSDPRPALRAVQAGALAVVLAALPWKAFELDRFFAPKELVLHLTALAAVVLVRRAGAPGTMWGMPGTAPGVPAASRIDHALALFLGLGIVGAALAANPWLGVRALAVSASGVALYQVGRLLARAGLDRPLLHGLALAAAVAAATALAQAYGVRSEYFSLNRAPGGTFGNRNSVAHLAAIGTPLLVLALVRGRALGARLLAPLGLALTAGVLVMSRSRGAWLAAAASLLPLAVGVVRAARLARAPAARPNAPRLALGRLAVVPLVAGAGVVAALTLPNRLDWRSAHPYLDSARGIVDYRGGSGGGRLKQYANSVRLAAAHPVLGTGPGNWPVHYPRYAPAGDPSLTREGMTANPWPSSDWVAVLSERGLPALLALAAAMAGLFWRAHQATWRAHDPERVLLGAALGATLVATTVVGLFDAVLLLAAPTLLAWTALGALAEGSAGGDRPAPAGRAAPYGRIGLGLLAVLPAVGAVRSGAQVAAMGMSTRDRPAALALAARLDPGGYRTRLRAATAVRGGGRCAAVRHHAGALARYWPNAAAPRRLLAGCGDGRPRHARRRG
jgi:O-antigen ligase